MKGVILAGGLGTRLLPLTLATNKHLLPVYDRPMVCYPLQQLAHAGITEVLIVTGEQHGDHFREQLGDGFQLAFQEGEGGIAEALSLAEDFAQGEPVVVILGDNIFQDALAPHLVEYRARGSGGMVFLKDVDDPERFGVAEVGADGVITRIVEKPAQPTSRYAVTGCYVYDSRVFDVIRTLAPSQRGELEITDVNNRYLEWGELTHATLPGWWTDAGTPESLHLASALVAADRGNPVLNPGASV